MKQVDGREDITHAVNVTIHCFFFYISEELITQQEVAYPLEKQEFTPKNKVKKKEKLQIQQLGAR